MKDRRSLDLGVDIADVLSGSWRSSVSDLGIPADRLRSILPLLLGSGSAGLAWRRLERSPLAASPELDIFRNAYILNAAHASKQRLQVAELFGRLRKRGIEALLLKGCAVANLYASPGLRPSGDIDVLVSPGQRFLAKDICHRFCVDLDHDVFVRFGKCHFSEIFAHSAVIDIAGCPVHTLGQEDQLSFLSLHFLKHGAMRPLWLCDIAAAVETQRSTFDWEPMLWKAFEMGRVDCLHRFIGQACPRSQLWKNSIPRKAAILATLVRNRGAKAMGLPTTEPASSRSANYKRGTQAHNPVELVSSLAKSYPSNNRLQRPD